MKTGRPKGAKTGTGARTARPFAIRRDADRDGWQVQQGKNWRRAREVSILAPAICLPHGEIVGEGVVVGRGDAIVVTA